MRASPPEGLPDLLWHPFGRSIRGASHIRSDTPNQDAIAWLTKAETGGPSIVAIADGHGSRQHSRSDIGSQLAVDIATSLLSEFLQQPQPRDLRTIKGLAEERLPAQLETRWKEAVDQHLKDHPLEPASVGTPTKEADSGPERAADEQRSVPYGTTLLAVAVTDEFILHLQLGDGDILTVSATGEVSRPLVKDERLIANQTTSLCLPHAKDFFRVGFQRLAGTPPALVLLSTDGYANSYRAEADFLKSGSDLLELLRKEGLEWVEARLGEWLAETSEQGSGDDITLGIVAHLPSLSGGGQSPQADVARPEMNQPAAYDGHLEHVMPELDKPSSFLLKRLIWLQWGVIGLLFLLVVVTSLIAYNIEALVASETMMRPPSPVSEASGPQEQRLGAAPPGSVRSADFPDHLPGNNLQDDELQAVPVRRSEESTPTGSGSRRSAESPHRDTLAGP